MLARNILFLFIFFVATGIWSAGYAQDSAESLSCNAEDRACILELLETEALSIENTAWRDQVTRELAKTLAADGDLEKAISLIERIENPDTKAMTIRGIGMAAADLQLSPAEYTQLWVRLRAEADKIGHPPSYAIALTYIAMAQAFAGDNEGAWQTASEMENDALRHKAYGETAEIQAERGDYDSAMKSIGFIDSLAFRNKAYETVSNILANNRKFEESLKAAMAIDNAYKRATAIQYLLDKQKPPNAED